VFESLALLWRRFSPLEERLLAEVRKALPTAAQHIFDAQVGGITLVQRSPPSWSEIRFYRIRRGRPDWSGVPLFPQTGEVRLAEMRFRAAGRSFKSALASINGHIFDLVTTPGPKAVAFLPLEVEGNVNLLADPLDAAVKKVPEVLPAAWENLLRRRSSAPSGAWVLHDRTTAYRVALDDGEYLVLAEREGDQFILHRLEPAADGLFHLQHHDGTPERLAGDPEDLIRGV